MFANQADDFAPNKAGTTVEERTLILEAFEGHMMGGYSARFFPMHSHQTLARLQDEFPDFKQSYNAIIRKANMNMETILIEKMKDDEKPTNLRAFELLTRNRKGFRAEPEPEKDNTPVKIEIVGITNREEANEYRKNHQI